MDRAEQLAVGTHQQRRTTALGDLVDFPGHRRQHVGTRQANKRQHRIHGPLAIDTALIVNTGQAGLGAEWHGGQRLSGRLGLWIKAAQVLDNRLALGRVIGQRGEQRPFGQLLGADTRRCVNSAATTVTEGDGAGLVQHQHMHVTRGFHRTTGFGDDVQAH
ncbi:hypothetical protein D3C78_1465270 [compost metagenome]